MSLDDEMNVADKTAMGLEDCTNKDVLHHAAKHLFINDDGLLFGMFLKQEMRNVYAVHQSQLLSKDLSAW